ncbi:porin [Epilithonimonas hungarica]|uniref:Short chain amide porin n=1 Tax=Epilithonimonas hungarica TaxID=454006 RepID=A0A1G7IC42_9FLAO|nr:porin [Epilithonimonas hungarica]SDF10327.1 short chain amide porin [Epilithonimonas hungarica]
MKKILTFIGLALFSASLYSQGSPDYGNGLKLNLNPEGDKYVRFILWNQIWLRNTEMNPGTMVSDEATKNSWNIGNRRLRALAYAQITKRYMVLMHFGINNQTFINGGGSGSTGTGGYGNGKKPQMFFHDAWNEYAVVLPGEAGKFSLSIGAGLHYYMGLSRMTMASTLNFLTVDSPIFTWPLIDNSDQFARQMGMFAKGKYGKFEYRFSLNKPFATNLAPVDVTNPAARVAVDNNGNPEFSKAGYVEYQFLDSESNLLPFKVGSYLGTKRVFNLGAGFYHQKDGTRTSVNSQIEKHDIALYAIDAFADLPLGNAKNKMALSAYAGFYNYNFGPNYLRNLGIMNVGSNDPNFIGDKAIAGPGNLQPMIGSGNIYYLQAGLLLPSNADKPKIRIQPFAAYTNKNFKALENSSSQFDVGANWFIDGHHAKLTTQYSTRPTYTSASSEPKSKGEFILQFQIYL